MPNTITVLKYPLPDSGMAWVSLPKGARILHVDSQYGKLQMWAAVNRFAAPEPRAFAVLMTGFDEVAESAVHIGTVLTDGGALVRHVFEITASMPEGT